MSLWKKVTGKSWKRVAKRLKSHAFGTGWITDTLMVGGELGIKEARRASHKLDEFHDKYSAKYGGMALQAAGAITTVAAGWTGAGALVGMAMTAAGAAMTAASQVAEQQKAVKEQEKAEQKAREMAGTGHNLETSKVAATQQDTAGDKAVARRTEVQQQQAAAAMVSSGAAAGGGGSGTSGVKIVSSMAPSAAGASTGTLGTKQAAGATVLRTARAANKRKSQLGKQSTLG